MGQLETILIVGGIIAALLIVAFIFSHASVWLHGRPGTPSIKGSSGLVLPDKIDGTPVVWVDTNGNYLPPGSTCPAIGCHTLSKPGTPGVTTPFPTGLVIAGVVAVLLINATSRARGL